MKNKLIIALSLLLLLVALYFMTKDFFFDKEADQNNPYEYEIDKLRETDSSLLCYSEIQKISPVLNKIFGVAVDKQDNIYISGDSKIAIYNRIGNLIDTFNVSEDAYCLTISPDDKIYLGMWDHIEVYDKTGTLISKWKPQHEKSIITSIAVNDSSVFIADAGQKIVYHFNLDGELLNEIGGKDSTKGVKGFIIPSPYFDLAIGRDDELWLVNPGRHSFESYTYDGDLISSWKRTSMQNDGFSGCCNPSHFAILSDGSFVTSEKGIERVKIHLPSGDFKCLVAGPDKFEEGTKGIDLAVDSKDRILVLDPQNGMIRIFEKKL
ncbi:MAG: hypothetical protein K9J13_08265 [Saprospiraceae bacterium]|nr:hypothetical protein [Saprospiraceae bacterium]